MDHGLEYLEDSVALFCFFFPAVVPHQLGAISFVRLFNIDLTHLYSLGLGDLHCRCFVTS